jgi:hypothetical protein
MRRHITDLLTYFIIRMQLAQKLYEGVQLSDGKAAGLITYTRTDGLHVGITLAAWMFVCGVWLV